MWSKNCKKLVSFSRHSLQQQKIAKTTTIIFHFVIKCGKKDCSVEIIPTVIDGYSGAYFRFYFLVLFLCVLSTHIACPMVVTKNE